MMVKYRYLAPLAFFAMIGVSLACTLGGGAESAPTSTPTQVAQITVAPTTTASPTVALPSDTPTSSPTATPTATPTPIVGNGPGGCVLKSTFIADVTIPDGTQLAPNASFVKTWRIRNDGTCNWDSGYQLVYSDGAQMSAPGAVNIPATAAGQTNDFSVNLAAPGAVGDYTGRWRLRASNNAIFGGFTVVIRVIGTPTPTPSPSATPTLTGGGVWGGVWETNCGSSNCAQMSLVQTGNRVVGTYAGGEGSIDGTAAGNRLTGTWRRGSGNGTFDLWIEGSGLRWHGNWNGTNQWCGHRAGQTDLTPCGVSTWYGTWITNFEGSVPCGDMVLNQSGDSVTGSCSSGGSITGTVDGTKLSGAMTRNPGSPTQVTLNFDFFMVAGGLQFQGNYSGTSFWCGYRSGSSLPSPCKLP